MYVSIFNRSTHILLFYIRFSPLAACSEQDIVLFKHGGALMLGQVIWNVAIDGVPLTRVKLFIRPLFSKKRYAVCKSTMESLYITTGSIVDVLQYHKLSDNSVGVLVPLLYRNS